MPTSPYIYNTIEEAVSGLRTAELDVAADMGEAMVEAAYGDLVHSIASSCEPSVARELLRRTLGTSTDEQGGTT